MRERIISFTPVFIAIDNIAGKCNVEGHVCCSNISRALRKVNYWSFTTNYVSEPPSVLPSVGVAAYPYHAIFAATNLLQTPKEETIKC